MKGKHISTSPCPFFQTDNLYVLQIVAFLSTILVLVFSFSVAFYLVEWEERILFYY